LGKDNKCRNAVSKWSIKINRVEKFLKGWGLNLKGQNRRYKVALRKELSELEIKEEEGLLNSASLDRKTFIQTRDVKTGRKRRDVLTQKVQ
jgi:hypothetical protein